MKKLIVAFGVALFATASVSAYYHFAGYEIRWGGNWDDKCLQCGHAPSGYKDEPGCTIVFIDVVQWLEHGPYGYADYPESVFGIGVPYTIYRDGAAIATGVTEYGLDRSIWFTDYDVEPGRTYSYEIKVRGEDMASFLGNTPYAPGTSNAYEYTTGPLDVGCYFTYTASVGTNEIIFTEAGGERNVGLAIYKQTAPSVAIREERPPVSVSSDVEWIWPRFDAADWQCKKIIIWADENDTGAAREGVVTISYPTGYGEGFEWHITVRQTAIAPTITFDANGGTFSNGAATKAVEAKPGNLWGKLPMPSKSGQVFDGWFTAASGGEIVTASSAVPSGNTIYYANWTPRLGLAAASEWGGEFETDSWCGQGTVAHDGRDALRSGIVYDGQSSYLMTRVNGIGMSGDGLLTFWWKVSCEAGGNDALRLLVDGTQVAMISGDVGWTKVEVPIWVPETGTRTIKWNYTKNGSVTKGEDFGWIDQVSWMPPKWMTGIFVFEGNGGKFSDGKPRKYVDARPGNLWGKLPMPAKDGYVFVGWYTAMYGGEMVTSSGTVPKYYANYYAHWTPRLGLAAASEWPKEFQTDSWCGQGAVSHDGADALRTGIIYDGQNSYLQTKVSGPGTLTFWWKVSCEAGGNDALRFLLDGVQKYSISGEKDWAKVTVDVTGSGTHILKWNYTKNASVSKGQDFGWIDQIGWTAK